mgnify:CR=1 FL=1
MSALFISALKNCFTKSGEEIKYDKLILATGSTPVAPHIPGSTLGNVFTVPKNKDYIDEMLSSLAGLKHIAIVGRNHRHRARRRTETHR